MSPNAGDDESSLAMFHSRRIGLTGNGAPTPLIAGGKLTGQTRGTELGLLAARTGGVGDQSGETIAVARVRRGLFNRLYVGGISTLRAGNGEVSATLGADARVVLKRRLTLTGLVATTTGTAPAG